MKTADHHEAAFAFASYNAGLCKLAPGKINILPVGNGLINHTYQVTCASGHSFLLQQINKNVFSNPRDVQDNYIKIWRYSEFESIGLKLPSPCYHAKLNSLYKDSNGEYWRAFEFIKDSVTHSIAKTPQQAKATAKAFAKFTSAFKGFDVDTLKIIIPDFHNVSYRYSEMENAEKKGRKDLIEKAQPIVKELKDRERYLHFYEVITSTEEFPLRVMHHDAKIANVLFNKTTGRVSCIVDFDTVMPGYFFSDLGDMIRSMACNYDENFLHPEKIKIRKAYYESIINGYLSMMEKDLTAPEKKYIHYSGLLMIYMQAMRFISDFMNGSIYYKVEYAGQNFDRALNQLTLLKRLEEYLRSEHKLKI